MCDRVAGPFATFSIAKAFARLVGAMDWWIDWFTHPETRLDSYWVAYELPKLLNPPEGLY